VFTTSKYHEQAYVCMAVKLPVLCQRLSSLQGLVYQQFLLTVLFVYGKLCLWFLIL